MGVIYIETKQGCGLYWNETGVRYILEPSKGVTKMEDWWPQDLEKQAEPHWLHVQQSVLLTQ